MPLQAVTPTSAVAGSMLNVVGTIAASKGATPDGTLTVSVSSLFSSPPLGFAQSLLEEYVWEPTECFVYQPIPILGVCGRRLALPCVYVVAPSCPLQ